MHRTSAAPFIAAAAVPSTAADHRLGAGYRPRLPFIPTRRPATLGVFAAVLRSKRGVKIGGVTGHEFAACLLFFYYMKTTCVTFYIFSLRRDTTKVISKYIFNSLFTILTSTSISDQL
jgi:hypothetical protein